MAYLLIVGASFGFCAGNLFQIYVQRTTKKGGKADG